MTEQCFWNPYAKGADYAGIWAQAQTFEGKRVRVVKDGREYRGVCKLTTVAHPTPGIGVTVHDGFADRWVGGRFEAIELEAAQ